MRTQRTPGAEGSAGAPASGWPLTQDGSGGNEQQGRGLRSALTGPPVRAGGVFVLPPSTDYSPILWCPQDANLHQIHAVDGIVESSTYGFTELQAQRHCARPTELA